MVEGYDTLAKLCEIETLIFSFRFIECFTCIIVGCEYTNVHQSLLIIYFGRNQYVNGGIPNDDLPFFCN